MEMNKANPLSVEYSAGTNLRHVRNRTSHNTPEIQKSSYNKESALSTAKQGSAASQHQLPSKQNRTDKGNHQQKQKEFQNKVQHDMSPQVLKGKTQLARDYYLMQAFIQQPHSMKTLTQAAQDIKVLHQQIRSREHSIKRKHSKTSEPSNSERIDHQKEQNTVKNLGIQQTYYTYSQAHNKNVTKHDSQVASAKQQYKRHSGQFSDSNSLKRNSQTNYSESCAGTTPNTPSVTNFFKRKWGGSSSTKSYKSASSIKSAMQTIQTPKAVTASVTGYDEIMAKQKHGRKETIRPPSSQLKETRESTRKECTLKSNTAQGMLQSAQSLLNMPSANSVGLQNHKSIRSSSNEVRSNNDDFTSSYNLRQKQLLQQENTNIKPSQTTPGKKNSRQIQNQNLGPAQLMPPKPQSQNKNTQKQQQRQQSKSKSTT